MTATSPSRTPSRIRRRSERGYILITIIFAFAVMAIVAAMVAPAMIFELKRDREEEMIHRGAQYARAIRAYVKKNGRYPMRLEDLDDTNKIRYLRRHYKDPITGKDFRLLHQGEVPMLAGGLTTAAGLGANGVAGAQGVQQQAAAQIAQGLAAGQAAQNGGSLFGTAGQNDNTDQQGAQNGQSPAPDNGSDVGNATGPAQPGQNQNTSSTGLFANTNGAQAFGGGPIVGVASISKEKSIRIFNKKDHYKDWYFIYDPAMDRGGLITGPAQPPLPGSTNNLNGQTPGQNGASPTGLGGTTPGSGSTFNGLGGGGNQNNNNGQGGFQPPGQLPEQ
jgi:hypothetical protein